MKKRISLMILVVIISSVFVSAFAIDIDKEVENAIRDYSVFLEETGLRSKARKPGEPKSQSEAMNGYLHAYEVFMKEKKAGKINSIAFRAAEKMLIGAARFNSLKGSTSKISKFLNKKGKSGNLYQALKILTETYKNSSGQKIEGAGIWVLLRDTKGIKKLNSKTLSDKNGNMCIPALTAEEITSICKSWGGLSERIFAAWFYAFNQYNKN